MFFRHPTGRSLIKSVTTSSQFIPCGNYNKDGSCQDAMLHLDKNYCKRIHACTLCFYALNGMTNLHRQTECPLLQLI
jgi:hypothetical protein